MGMFPFRDGVPLSLFGFPNTHIFREEFVPKGVYYEWRAARRRQNSSRRRLPLLSARHENKEPSFFLEAGGERTRVRGADHDRLA